jgi:hypothetical protein
MLSTAFKTLIFVDSMRGFKKSYITTPTIAEMLFLSISALLFLDIMGVLEL